MVTGLDDVALTRSLRPAVEGNVLLVRGDGYTFRHALIREAIHEDLLPGERIGLHVRYAGALAEDPALRPGRRALSLAHHWFAAHDITRALVSAWDAVAETRAGLAYAEALRMASRVLELWERVPDAAALIGASRGEVLQEAVDLASLSGEAKLGIRLATAALEEVTDPERAAYLLRRRGTLAMELGRNDGMDDLRAAADRAPADPPNAERARALAALAMQFGSVRAMDGVADQIIKEGLAIARAVGDTTTEISLEMNVSWQRLFRDGDMQAHIAAIRALRARAVELGSFEQLLRSFINESDVLEMYGRHAEAAEVARQGRARAEEYGLGRTAGTLLAVNLAEPLVSLGQWDEALTIVAEELAREPSGVLQANLRYVAAEILIARGELDRAVPLIAAAPRLVGHGVASKAQNLFPVCRVQAQLRLAQGDPEGTFEALRPVFEETGLPNESRYALPALMVAATACVALGGRALGNGASGGRALSGGGYAEEIRARVDGLRIYGPEQAAYRLTTLAEVRRAEGVLDRGAWNEAVRLWEELQRPYDLAFALVRAADAASAEGDRDRAAALLRRAAGLSDRLGTPLLREEIDLLARRARISLSGARPVLGPGLTPRETEVLRLLAEGRSNREIADALFISAKTASVHVSNILGKLNVSTRGEAAALAHRLHLTLDP
jgi:DNA-binding CsgD family transcriptional regulator